MQLFQRLGLHQVIDLSQRLLIGKNLSAFGRSAKTRGKVGDVAYRAVVQLTLKPDITHGRIPSRQSYT